MVAADITDPQAVFTDPVAGAILDLGEPVVIVLAGVLHCVDDPIAVAGHYMRAAAPGSFLVVCDYVTENDILRARIEALMAATAPSWRVRRARDVDDILRGTAVLRPGAGDVAHWRPDRTPLRSITGMPPSLSLYGAVARISRSKYAGLYLCWPHSRSSR
ncbi:SAM-dependent methyltransferase [Embleya sp. NPDC005575]|uniref:SAM-dependent methyltransferase n=1 Tax=Embleya sp. NPDC005575 TaxID=3156892 RepID=UPI0033A73D1B